ncbi:CBS_pair_BON_assoc domain containing protein [Acidimicrobiia bacterium]
MLRDVPVREIMSTDVLTFAPADNVRDAMRALLRRNVDGAPVVDADGQCVGLLSTSDLIVEEARVHLPTVITLLGAYLELPSSQKRFDADMAKALGSTVGEVMTAGITTIGPDDTVEQAATLLHEEGADRLAVIDEDGRLVGLVARGDIVRAIVREFDEQDAGTDAAAGAAGSGE